MSHGPYLIFTEIFVTIDKDKHSKTILKTEESSNPVAFYFFLTVIHSKYYITIHFICETKTKLTKNIPYPYWIRWTYIFFYAIMLLFT